MSGRGGYGEEFRDLGRRCGGGGGGVYATVASVGKANETEAGEN